MGAVLKGLSKLERQLGDEEEMIEVEREGGGTGEAAAVAGLQKYYRGQLEVPEQAAMSATSPDQNPSEHACNTLLPCIPYRLLMKRRYHLFFGRRFLPHFSWPSLPGYFTMISEFVASAKLEFLGPSHCKNFPIS